MSVRVLMLEAPEALLEERARLGLDRRDEMWDGVLHVVPLPLVRQQDIGSQLLLALAPQAQRRGLELLYGTGLFRPGRDDDYRVPDQVLFDSAVASRQGVEGAAHAVIEIRSPGDETYDKIPFYLDVGVREIVVIDRDTLTVEIFRGGDADDQPTPAPDTRIGALDVELERVDDDHIRLRWDDGQSDVRV